MGQDKGEGGGDSGASGNAHREAIGDSGKDR